MMKDISIGLQLYSVRSSYAVDLAATLAGAKKMGCDAVEFFWVLPCRAAELKHLLDDNGLTVCGWHTGLECLEGDRLYATLEYHDRIGNRLLGINSSPDMFAEPDSAFAFRDRLSAAQEAVKKYGFNVEYHNHWWEFDGTCPYNTIADSAAMLQIDVGHVQRSGNSPAEMLDKYSGKVASVHIKPYSAANCYDCHIGQDDIDWNSVISRCLRDRIPYAIIETEGESEQMANAAKNTALFKEMLKNF